MPDIPIFEYDNTGWLINIPHDGREIQLRTREALFYHPRVVGRSTLVLATTGCRSSTAEQMVLKISFPDAAGRDEAQLIKDIRTKVDTLCADDTQNSHEWVKNHLPFVHFDGTYDFAGDCTVRRVEAWLTGDDVNWQQIRFQYRRRVCLVILHERLRPIEDLVNAESVYKVLFDAIQGQVMHTPQLTTSCADLCPTVHRWVYDHVKLLHRDISVSNIMWRLGADDVPYGVLNDWDLASFPDDAVGSAGHRTGTKPFMSIDFHKNPANPPRHLYRHDLESFIWVLLFIIRQYIFNNSTGLVYRDMSAEENWGVMSDANLKTAKESLLDDVRGQLPVMLQGIDPAFQSVQGVLERLLAWLDFGRSEAKLHISKARVLQELGQVNPDPPFDNETLGGNFTHKLFVDTFKEKLCNCVRYPEASPTNVNASSHDPVA